MKRRRRRKQQPPWIQAWLALALPLLSWHSQVLANLVVRRPPPGVLLFLGLIQGLLILAGLGLGVWALAARGRSGPGVVAPAVIGLVIGTGTLQLVCLLITLSALA